MSRISTERDIVTSAKIRAEAEAGHKKSLPKMKMSVSAAVCALILICGLTVSAANFGWSQKLFGSGAAVIEKNINDYSVNIGNVKIENAESVPYNFTIGDVISDGNSLYFNLLVDGMAIEPGWADHWCIAGITDPKYFNAISTDWFALGMEGDTANTAVYLNCVNEIKKGDVLEFELDEQNIVTDENGEVLSISRTLLATISFEIQSDINNMKKIVNVNHTAIFKDRPSPEFDAEYDEDKIAAVEMYVKTISVSPFKYVINATADPAQPLGTGTSNPEFGWGNIWFIYKNGDRVCFTPSSASYEAKEDCQEILIYSDFSITHGEAQMGVLDFNEIEAIEFDGVTVPIE
ncbi:MAG: DUF4179 domain-containing protein [Oscillospiraceae bacterium]|nr:DUF4179 domain-containing protein [Oscillospiraceae bacterium]